MQNISDSPPRAPPIKYTAPLGTRWAKEKAAAGGAAAFDLPTDPKTIGPWILGECVGKGASGRVKIAKHRRTGQLAAVKILPVAPLVSSRASLATQQAKSDKQRLGIDREITMMKLMNHPNIMRIYDVYEGDKELFLVLEYVEGGELFDFLVNRGRMPPNEALIYFRQIVYGLNYAHTFSIIHRDLKPENILIASLSPPQIKIADWGMAAFAPPTLQLETSCGSPHYASPEIVNGEKYQGNATDIWSCGVILYALLTGRLPFDDKNVRNLLSKVKSGKYEMPAWIDPLAKDLLSKMLIVDVKQRITIPEILAHPWLVSHASIPFAGTGGATFTLLAPPLPPSPSILARPITSPNMIDAELFSSLRIIWGRHADAQGESIKRDLCAPAGYGVHAKAFYFLLGKYREESYRNRTHDAMVDAAQQQQQGLAASGGKLDTVKFNLGWELEHASGLQKYEVPKTHPIFSAAPQAASSSSTTPTAASTGYPTHLSTGAVGSRKRTFTDGSLPSSTQHDQRGEPPSPAGSRLPPKAQAHAFTHAQQERESASSSALPNHTVTSTTARFSASVGSGSGAGAGAGVGAGAGRGGPRQFPPRRGYTYSATSEGQKQHQHQHQQTHRQQHEALGFSQHLQQLQARAASASASYRPKSSAGPITPFTDAERRAKVGGHSGAGAGAAGPAAVAVTLEPTSRPPLATISSRGVCAGVTVGTAPSGSHDEPILPLLTAPKMENAQLQRTMDDITQKVNDLVQAVTQAPSPPPLPPLGGSSNVSSAGGGGGVGESKDTVTVKASAAGAAAARVVNEDKENQSIDEESWSHVSVSGETDRVGGLGLGVGVGGVGVRDVGKDVSNSAVASVQVSPTKPKKEKERKGRPPPLELPSLHARRSTLSAALGSPIALSSPIHPLPSSANRIMASPVVGEFKGWFSNLFSWKQSSAHGGVLYSPDDIYRTRANVARLLDGLRVTLASSTSTFTSSSNEGCHPSDHAGVGSVSEVLLCRVDQPVVDAATGTTLKNVRFRVEFRAGPGSPGAGEHHHHHHQQQTVLLSPTVEEPASMLPAPSPNPSQLATPISGSGVGIGGGTASTNASRGPRASILLGRASSHSASLPLPTTPAHHHTQHKWDMPPGCACAVALVHEKGSMSTFRAVWRRLKEEYADAAAGPAYQCFSPALPPTPYTETQRLAV